jgi:GTP-binding protein
MILWFPAAYCFHALQVFLSAPRLLNLEEAMGYVAGDELLEVTPSAVRIRKEVLDPVQRKAQARRAASRQ